MRLSALLPSLFSSPASLHGTMSSTPTPPTPEPSTVAARARSSLPPTHTSKIPFFASAAQPEIGTSFPSPLLSPLTDTCVHSPSESERSVLPRSIDGTIRGRLEISTRCVLLPLSLSCTGTDGVWVGTRWLQAWSKELTQGSRLAYFGLTTLLGSSHLMSLSEMRANVGLLGSQTLGEEYCDIMQYAVQTRKPPTRRVRPSLPSIELY